MSPKAVVLLSGGLDSATALAMARSRGLECHALSFSYGSRHEAAELRAAQNLAAAMGTQSWRVSEVPTFGECSSALLEGGPAVPKGRTPSEMVHGVAPTFVPGRNIVFLALGASLAACLGAESVFIGVNAVDFSGYPDCRPAFVDAMRKAAALGLGAEMRIEAPLVSMTKAEIIRKGVELGVPFELTHSCYDPVLRPSPTNGPCDAMDSAMRRCSEPALWDGPGVQWCAGHKRPSASHALAFDALACGACDSCAIRRRGFEEAGVEDPTRYVKAPS